MRGANPATANRGVERLPTTIGPHFVPHVIQETTLRVDVDQTDRNSFQVLEVLVRAVLSLGTSHWSLVNCHSFFVPRCSIQPLPS